MEKETKFKLKEKVVVTEGFYKGKYGKIDRLGYNEKWVVDSPIWRWLFCGWRICYFIPEEHLKSRKNKAKIEEEKPKIKPEIKEEGEVIRFDYGTGFSSKITDTKPKMKKLIMEIEEKIKKKEEWLTYVDKDKKKSFINLKNIRAIYKE